MGAGEVGGWSWEGMGIEEWWGVCVEKNDWERYELMAERVGVSRVGCRERSGPVESCYSFLHFLIR